jgi:hypothetical protein
MVNYLLMLPWPTIPPFAEGETARDALYRPASCEKLLCLRMIICRNQKVCHHHL